MIVMVVGSGVALAGKVLSFLDVDLEAKLGGTSGDPVHQTLNVTNTVGNYSTITCKQHFPHQDLGCACFCSEKGDIKQVGVWM